MSDQDAQIFINPFRSTFCEMFNCGTANKWLLGRPQPGALVMPGNLRLCDKCAISVMENLPDELLKHVDVERALSLMDEGAKDKLFDKLFPAAEPGEALSAILAVMSDEELNAALLEWGYVPETKQPVPEPGMTEQQAAQTQLKCPQCTYETWSPTSLRGHISAKHGRSK